MASRTRAALLAAVGIAGVALLLHPCGDAPRRGADVDLPTKIETPSTAGDAQDRPRRRATPDDSPTPSVESPPPAAATQRTSVSVLVVAKDDGAAVASANVLLLEETDGKDDVEHRGKTDDSGVALFADLPPCTAMVRAWADDFVRSDFTGDAAKPGEELKLVVRLDRGAPLEGVVRDAKSGRPIAGATVDVVLGGSIDGIGSSGTTAPHLGLLTTGEDGRFRLRVPPDEMVTPTASARGFVPTGRTVIVHRGEKQAPLVLRLDAGGTLRGTVRAPNGAAVAGATVCAVPADQRDLLSKPYGDYAAGGGGRRWTALYATTDAGGRYELDGLARGGVYVAFATADGWAWSAAIERVLATDAAPAADVDFALRKTCVLVVRVLDAFGKPHAARVSIETSRDETFRHQPQETDETGATQFSDIDPGRYRVSVYSTTAPSETAYVEVADGATVECVVRLQRGVVISGVVVDDRGKPVEGAGVNAFGTRNVADSSAPASFGHADSAKDGTFHIDGLREEPHTLRTYGLMDFADTDLAAIDAPAKNVRFVLPRTATVTLRPAVPLPEQFSLRIEFPTRISPTGATEWSGGGDRPYQLIDGCLTVFAVKPGSGRIRLMSKEFTPLVREFDAKPGETIDLGEATLDPGVDVAGRVEDAAGAPVFVARVTAGGAYAGDTVSPDVRRTSTAPDGSFRLEHMAAGPLDLTVAAPEFVRTTTRVDAASGGGTVVVRLFRGASLTVTVVDAAGAPVPGATVVVWTPAAPGDATRDRADHRGVAELRVAPGKVRVGVDGRHEETDVELAEGGETSVRLVVK